MIKRTLFFTNNCHLSTKNEQLIIAQDKESVSVPIEDIGYMVLENQQITLSMPLLDRLSQNNVAVIFCNAAHMPKSMLWPLESNYVQAELYRSQVAVSEPLKKQLWKQTIESKINNQARLLKKTGKNSMALNGLADQVKSGDTTGREGVAARKYWNLLFGNSFIRERYGAPPNHWLNYGYIVLRAAVARALAGSGLLPAFGIHHHNRYNAFCLADDIMEPYRPYVDEIIIDLYEKYPGEERLDTEIKAELLKVLSCDVVFENTRRPLMVGLSQTTASLARCFAGEQKKIEYPVFE